jgi:hypothetical protein
MVSGNSAPASPHISSEDSEGDILIPDREDSGVGQAVFGAGFRIVDNDAPTWTVPQFPFCEHVPVSNRLPEVSEWMTVADKHMLAANAHQEIPWEQFIDLIVERRESRFAAVEQKRYEEYSPVFGPGNDVIVAAVRIVWSETRITTLIVAGTVNWPIAHSGVALGALFKEAPAHSEVIVLLESDDVCADLLDGQDMECKNLDPAISVTPLSGEICCWNGDSEICGVYSGRLMMR